jgi:hypothetical protein
MKILKVGMCSVVALVMGGCATSFTGSAHVEDGRSGCEVKCRGQGMELVGMVYMGEYSSACVCAIPGQATAVETLRAASSGAVASGAAGVIMQMRAQQSAHY